MSKRVTATKLAREIPPEIREILGDPPIVSGETADVYWGMIASFAKFVAPSDFIAWLLIKDLADARIEIHRYRRCKAQLMVLPTRRSFQQQVDAWTNSIEADPKKVREEAQKEKQELQKSGKPPAEIEKIFKQIDRETEAKACKAQAHARQQVQIWSNKVITETDIAAHYKEWVASQDRLDPRESSAEKKFTEARLELGRYLKGRESLLWEAIGGAEIIDIKRPPEVLEEPHKPLLPPPTKADQAEIERVGDRQGDATAKPIKPGLAGRLRRLFRRAG